MNSKTEEIVRRLRGLADEPSHPRASEFLDIAADRLEMLEAEVARLKAWQRWIPVPERLPEVSMRTLVSIDECVGVAYFVHGNSGMCFFSDYTGKPLIFVTHWMPMPEPRRSEECGDG